MTLDELDLNDKRQVYEFMHSAHKWANMERAWMNDSVRIPDYPDRIYHPVNATETILHFTMQIAHWKWFANGRYRGDAEVIASELVGFINRFESWALNRRNTNGESSSYQDLD